MIRFNLNGQWQEEENIDPSCTILRYFRTKLVLSDTKEGCAAGDCGACTLMVVKPVSESELHFQTLNSCIALLAHLNGCYVFTASGLGAAELHPAQQAMVDFHGAQCGFCTPGIVMSLATLYQQTLSSGKALEDLTEDDIHQALSGNLCRCTGYVPIIKAAKSMSDYPQADLSDLFTEVTTPIQSVSESADASDSASDLTPALKQANRQVFQPQSEASLQQLLSQYPDAWIWAGGTDLGLEITQRHQEPETLIHLESVQSLRSVSQSDGLLSLGALCTYSDLETQLHPYFPSLTQLVQRIASRQIRNLGTLGGNIANASPIGDLPPVFLALNATLVLNQGGQERTLPLQEFFLGYKHTALAKGEYVKALQVPLLADDEELFCWKISKRHDDDISAVMMAVWLKSDGQKIENIRIACGGMAAIPKRASHTEQALISQPLSLESMQQAGNKLELDYQPMSDVRASAQYRMQVAKNLLLKTLIEKTKEVA